MRNCGKRKWDEVENSFHEFFKFLCFFVHANFPIAERAVLLGAEHVDSKSQCGDTNWDQNPELFPT